MTKPPPMPEFDVPIASDSSGRLTTIWWDWLQRYFRWSEESAASGGEGGGAVDWDDVTDKPPTFPPTLPVPQSGVTNLVSDMALKAPLASPAFTGNPTAPTPTAGDSDTSIATTAFVANAVSTGGGAYLPLTGGTVNGNVTVNGQLTNTGTDNVLIDAGGTGSKGLVWSRSGSLRWQVYLGNVASGEHFNINRYNDSGTLIDNAFSINRSTGVASMGGLAVGNNGITVASNGITITAGGLVVGGAINFPNWGSGNYLSYTSGANSFSLGHASVGLSSMNVAPGTQRHLFAFAGTTYYSMDVAFFFPNVGNPTLGTSSFKWGQIYSTVGTISTSDANLKQDIRTLTAQEMTVARALKGIIRAYRVRDEVKKDPDAKIHVGVIAQQVKAVFDANGLDIHAYAFYEENTMVIDRYDEETSSWIQIPTSRIERAIKYDELQCWILAALLELLP